VETACEEMTASFDRVMGEWSARSTTLGRRVRITTRSCEFEGRAETLEADGALLVRRDDGRGERVLAGDCVHLRPAIEMVEEGV